MPLRRHRPLAVALAGIGIAGVVPALTAPADASPDRAHATYRITGPDVSSYQHPGGARIRWSKVQRSGAGFAIVKATESTTYVNPWFRRDYRAAADAGLVHGAYHFARPATPVAKSAMAQARAFAATIGQVQSRHTLPPALDLEVTGGLGRAQLVRWGQDFLIDMHQLTGRTAMLYTYPTFWTYSLGDPAAFARFPIWMASYSNSQPSGSTLWQYTSTARLRGIPGNVDMNRFVGAQDWNWSTLSDGRVSSGWQASAPGPAQAVTAGLGQSTSSSGVATVRWLPGDAGTAPITGYVVTMSPGHQRLTVPAYATSATFTGLTFGTAYRFRVAATNSVGTGQPSPTTSPVTPLAPTRFRATAPSASVAGQPVTVTGRLWRRDTHQEVPGATVKLLRRLPGARRWHAVDSATTDNTGAVSFTRRPQRDVQWRLAYAGHSPLHGTAITLETLVRPAVTASLDDTSPAPRQWVHLTGTLTPLTHAVLLTRQVLVDGAWQSVQHKTVDAGDFRFGFRAPASGSEVTRVVVGAAGGREATQTQRLSLTVSG